MLQTIEAFHLNESKPRLVTRGTTVLQTTRLGEQVAEGLRHVCWRIPMLIAWFSLMNQGERVGDGPLQYSISAGKGVCVFEL